MSDDKDIYMNPAELYREETFTDQKVGSIRQLTPVNPDGSTDTSREVLFIGSAQVMSPMGAIPISFPLQAKTVGEAAEQFAGEAEKAVEETAKELERLRREHQSKIVVPGQQGGIPGMGGMPGQGGGGIIT